MSSSVLSSLQWCLLLCCLVCRDSTQLLVWLQLKIHSVPSLQTAQVHSILRCQYNPLIQVHIIHLTPPFPPFSSFYSSLSPYPPNLNRKLEGSLIFFLSKQFPVPPPCYHTDFFTLTQYKLKPKPILDIQN